jgi:hypothetical protein
LMLDQGRGGTRIGSDGYHHCRTEDRPTGSDVSTRPEEDVEGAIEGLKGKPKSSLAASVATRTLSRKVSLNRTRARAKLDVRKEPEAKAAIDEREQRRRQR